MRASSMKPEMVPFRSVNMPLIDGETHAEETDGFLMDMLDYSLDASRIWRDKFEIRKFNLDGHKLRGRMLPLSKADARTSLLVSAYNDGGFRLVLHPAILMDLPCCTPSPYTPD
ncbi:hypothetical protein QR680_006746 [Steinernema hermaphroditum]|uniref:Uncharacterized protein n=1 Tax=Steinernema hermaphroditum TaxID=289476 RepID=A0AA39LXW5_9BILA|nr:hypothetical protein QR680_006746 [Steinernema hermaphroditum]